MTGLIADIERASTHDGPGIRTVVFLKGCPLRCRWCHNPECISPEPEMLYYPNRCIGCGQCANGCYAGARVLCGREMSAQDVMRTVLADRGYYRGTGGLTVSGGEPLFQADFTRELLSLARREGIHTAIETTLYRYDEELLSLCDLILFDVKHMDKERHREAVGVPLAPILENIRRACTLGIPMRARTPIVPGVNAERETIGAIAAFLRELSAVERYELLPYHPLGEAKRTALGDKEQSFEIPSKELMEELKTYAFVR